jgi:hypothetical protein
MLNLFNWNVNRRCFTEADGSVVKVLSRFRVVSRTCSKVRSHVGCSSSILDVFKVLVL